MRLICLLSMLFGLLRPDAGFAQSAAPAPPGTGPTVVSPRPQLLLEAGYHAGRNALPFRFGLGMQLDRYSFLGQFGCGTPNNPPALLGGMAFRVDLTRDPAITPYGLLGVTYWEYLAGKIGEGGTLNVINTDLGLGVRMRVWRGLYLRVQGAATRQSEAVLLWDEPGRYVRWRLAGEVGLGWRIGR